jgi:hypothetical protein
MEKWIFYLMMIAFLSHHVSGAFSMDSVTIIPTVSIAVYLLGCLYFLVKSIYLSGKTGFFYNLLIFFLLNTLSFLLMPDENQHYVSQFIHNSITIYKTIAVVLLSFFPFYFMSKRGLLHSDEMIQIFWFFLVAFSIIYFIESMILRNDFGLEGQVNAIYGVVYLLPFLFFFRARVTVRILIIIIFLLVLHSLKRGALITFLLGSGVLFTYSSYFKGNLRLKKSSVIRFIPIVVFFSLALYVVSLSDFFVERFANIDSDGGSGRDDIFQTLFLVWWNETEFVNFVFGNGFAGTIKFVDAFAHNDLLEVMVNYGLLGLMVYLGLWVVIIRVIGKLNFYPHLRYLLICILLMWVVDSMYHRFFSGLYSSPAVMALGFVFGQVELTLRRRSFPMATQ